MKQAMKWALCALLVLMLPCLSALAQEDVLSGRAYVDENGNAVCDSGETLMSGVPVQLERRAGDVWEPQAQTVTDAYGQYAFSGLDAGEYRLLCPLNDQTLYAASLGSSETWVDGVLCLEGVSLPGEADIGLRPAARLNVSAYVDSNGNGVRDKKERGLTGAKIEVLDASGNAVQAIGVTDADGALALSLAPGAHAMRVTLPDGYAFSDAGADNCVTGEEGTALSEAFSLTAETETTLSVAGRAAGYFSGRTFEDMNNNGVMDEGEPGVAGATVHLVGQKTGTERSITTDETGVYFFDRLPSDKYTVTVDMPEGMLFARYSNKGGDLRSIFTGAVYTRDFSVKSSAPVTNKNIGMVQKGAISGTAFLDLNYNGLRDEDEPGYAGVTVEAIKLSNGDSMGKATTDKNGDFRIENLRGGDYRLRAILPNDGSIFSFALEGEPDQVNRFSQRASRRENSIQPLTIASGGEVSALIGVARGASIRGTVFQDADYNGRRNGKEKAISGAKVRLLDESGNIVASATASGKGAYELEGILPGRYTLQVQRKTGYGFTRLRPQEKDGSYIAVLQGEWGVSEPLDISMGQELTGVNAGMLPSATVSGSFFQDVNDNGLWDEGEPGMTDAQVRLLSEDGETDLLAKPGTDGAYFFDGIMPGTYTLSYILPEHCEMARTVNGGNTVAHHEAEVPSVSLKIAMGDEAKAELAGAVVLGSFEGTAFCDANANGQRDAGEDALAGVSVTLASASGEQYETLSGTDGAFSLRGLRPDAYTLSLKLPQGSIFSHDVDGLALSAADEQSLECPWSSLIDRSSKLVGAVRPASLTGQIWMDENQDGVQGDDEWIMTGLTVSLISEADGSVAATALTDADGFAFDAVRPGTYTLSFLLPEQSTPAEDASSAFRLSGGAMVSDSLTVSEGQQTGGLSAGLVSRTSIGGTAELEVGGVRTPVPGVTVTLFQNGQPIQNAQTDENGSYRFDGLWPDNYAIGASLPGGIIFVRPDDPNYPQGASVIHDTQSGKSESFRLLMAQHQLDCDVLYIKPAKVGDIAWLDENANGLVDGSEPRLSGVSISLLQDGQTVYQTITDASGYYLLNQVYPGEYVLEAQAWPEVAPTRSVAALRIISSCLTSGDGTQAQSDAFRVESGETNLNFDLGYVLLDGRTLPAEASQPAPTRDWTLRNQQP